MLRLLLLCAFGERADELAHEVGEAEDGEEEDDEGSAGGGCGRAGVV